MAKINATYSSGYYISPDTDFRRLEEQQAAEQKRKRQRGDEDPDANMKRQTFAIPFDLFCDGCQSRIARGSHVYTNRRPTDRKYMDVVRIWSLEIRCRHCHANFYLETDPETPKETGGYKCASGCHRAEGDFYAINKMNSEAKSQWEKDQSEADDNPLAALERENEATRLLVERNRQIAEDVMDRADAGSDDGLLSFLRSGALQRQRDANQPLNDEHRNGSDATPSGSGDDAVTRRTDEEEASEEAEYLQFEKAMQAQREQQQSAMASKTTASAIRGGHASSLMKSAVNVVSEALLSGTSGGNTKARNPFVIDDEDDEGDEGLVVALVPHEPTSSPSAAARGDEARTSSSLSESAEQQPNNGGNKKSSLLSSMFDDDD